MGKDEDRTKVYPNETVDEGKTACPDRASSPIPVTTSHYPFTNAIYRPCVYRNRRPYSCLQRPIKIGSSVTFLVSLC